MQSEYILRFASPIDPKAKYEYRSIGGLAPGAIAFVDGTPYVLGEIVRGDAKYFYDCPEPPFIIHRHENGKWKRDSIKKMHPALTAMNLAIFSNPSMENAKAGGKASSEQINEWNKTLGKREAGPYAETLMSSIPRPKSGEIEYTCNVAGKSPALMNLDEFKREMRARLPKNTE